MVSFKAQLNAWKSVIFALFLRQFQSKFNDKFGLSWAFFEPFVFIFALSALRGLISGNDVHGIPIIMFMMVGMVGLQTFTTALQSVSTSVRSNKPLYAFRQVHPIAAVISAGLMELAIKIIVIGLLSLALYLLNMPVPTHNILMLIVLFFTVWAIAVSIGLMFAIAAAFVPEVDKVKQVLTRPLMFISCIFFSLQDIPEQYWYLLTWNPLVHVIEYARYSLYVGYGAKGTSLVYLFSVLISSLFFSLSLYHLTWKRVLSR